MPEAVLSRNGSAPAAASAREYLRGGLPAVYREDDDAFSMRFLTALEEAVLDPIVALLDSLPEHFHPLTAPPELVREMGTWLGLEVPESLSTDEGRNVRIQRLLTHHATAMMHARGTRAGLERLLRRSLPTLGITVIDEGRATVSQTPREAPEAPAPAFTVKTQATSLSSAEQEVVRRMIRTNAPVQARGFLQIGPDGEAVPL